MSEKELRDALLKQNGEGHAGPLEAELSALRNLVDAEHRRVRRLTIWLIVVWAVWILMVIAGLGAPMLAYQAARSNAPSPTTQPVQVAPAAAPASNHTGRAPVSIIGIIIGGFFFALFLSLPVVGLVLLIMVIVGRRTASTNQIRASVAALDAKLRLLTMTSVKPESRKEQP